MRKTSGQPPEQLSQVDRDARQVQDQCVQVHAVRRCEKSEPVGIRVHTVPAKEGGTSRIKARPPNHVDHPVIVVPVGVGEVSTRLGHHLLEISPALGDLASCLLVVTASQNGVELRVGREVLSFFSEPSTLALSMALVRVFTRSWLARSSLYSADAGKS